MTKYKCNRSDYCGFEFELSEYQNKVNCPMCHGTAEAKTPEPPKKPIKQQLKEDIVGMWKKGIKGKLTIIMGLIITATFLPLLLALVIGFLKLIGLVVSLLYQIAIWIVF